jgi:hypothetical protein
MARRKNLHRIRGIFEIILIIIAFFKIPSYEQEVLEIISKDSNVLSVWGNYWNDIVFFLLNHWEAISIIILVEALYSALTNRNLISDLVNEIRKAINFKKY